MCAAPGSAELAALISGLSSPDRASRETAAKELFARGHGLARAATIQWLRDPEFTAKLVLDASQFPVTTVGIAVTPETFERSRAANGSPRLADVPPDQDAMEFELHFAQHVQLDILTTREPGGTGAIARYLQKFGEGIQQVELLVAKCRRRNRNPALALQSAADIPSDARRGGRHSREFFSRLIAGQGAGTRQDPY